MSRYRNLREHYEMQVIGCMCKNPANVIALILFYYRKLSMLLQGFLSALPRTWIPLERLTQNRQDLKKQFFKRNSVE